MNRPDRAEAPLGPVEIARAAYRGISLYAPDRSPCRIDLSDNTNLFGVPPAALAVLRASPESRITRYPSLYASSLKNSLARYAGVDPACIVTGCGSDDVLDSAIRAFSEPGDLVITSAPSFAMIPLFAKMNGLEVREIPLLQNGEPNTASICSEAAAVTYICSPNNPTGNSASRASIEQVLAHARGVVIVDEAYAEFADESVLHLAPSNPRLLVVRTLSKAFGLAGLRIGYAVGNPALVAEVEKSRGPYKVSSLAEEAAVAALDSDRLWVAEKVAEMRVNRDRFARELRNRGMAPLRSDANFLLVPVPDAARISTSMREAGVAVRPFTKLPNIGDALRISIGPWPMLAEAISALEAALT